MIWFFIVILFVSCGTMEMASNWRDREIKIDGYQDDWRDALTYLEKKKISVGLFNDDSFLYACIVTGDRRIRSQLLRRGFTIWFDEKGGKDKKFGIRYPIGMEDMGPTKMGEMMGDQQEGRIRDLQLSRLNDVEILGPGKEDRRREAISQLKGLEIKLVTNVDLMIYEIKIPLFYDDQNSFSVASNPGDIVGIGLETAKIDKEFMREQMRETGGGGMEGGRGGMRGGGRRSGGGGRPGGGMQMPEQLDFWAKVELATK